MAFLTVDNLSLRLEGKLLLSSVSFSVEKGTISLIAGKNGSGKSLLLKTIKGLEKETEGNIILEGKKLKRKERLSDFGLVFQDTDLQIVGQTVEKDIRFGAENIGIDENLIKTKTDELMRKFNLDYARNLNPSILSGGEKRKLSIAGVLIMGIKVLLLDEPFANLDYPSVITVINTLNELKKDGFTILIVSHEAEKFLYYTDRVLIIDEGHLVSDNASSNSIQELIKNNIYIPRNASFEDLRWN